MQSLVYGCELETCRREGMRPHAYPMTLHCDDLQAWAGYESILWQS